MGMQNYGYDPMAFAEARIASKARRNQTISSGIGSAVTQIGTAAAATVKQRKADEVQYRQALQARDAYVGVLNYANSLAQEEGKTIEGLGELDAINYVNPPPKGDSEALKSYLENTPKLIDSAVVAILQNPNADTTVIDGMLKLPGYSADVRKMLLEQRGKTQTGEVAGIASDNTLRTGVAQAPKWQAEDRAMEGAPPEAGFNLQKSQLGQGGMTPNYLEPNPNPTQEQFLGEAAKIAPGMPSSQLTETAAGAQFPTQKQQFAESREANVQGRHEQNLLEKQRARIQRHQENQQSIGIAKQNIEKGIVTGLIENIPTQVRMVELDYQDLNDELDGLNTQLEAAKATKNAMSADTIKSQMKDIENQRKALEKQHKELLDLEVKAKDKARSLAGIPPSQVGGATEPNPREPRGSRTPAPTITPSIPETIPTPIIDLKSKYGLDY